MTARSPGANNNVGNTAERVLRQVHCSVLTLKLWGFVSPALAGQTDEKESKGDT